MARRAPQPGRRSGGTGRRSGQGIDEASVLYDEEGNPINEDQGQPSSEQLRQAEQQAQREQQREQQQRESIELSAGISDSINARVKGLLGGREAVRKLRDLGDDNEQYADFYEKNRPAFERLLQMDLQGTYQALVLNAENRKKLYKELVEQNVIGKQDLKALQGVISPQPYLQYVRNLGRRAAREGAEALTPDDQESLSRAEQPQMAALLARLKSENKINDQEESRLLALGPKTPEQVDAARAQIVEMLKAHDAAAHTSYHASWLRFNENEAKIAAEFDKYIEQYNTLVQGLVEQIQREFDQAEQNRLKDERLRALSRDTGLPIRKGQVLWGVGIRNTTAEAEKNHRIEINDIVFAGVEKDPELHEDFQILLPTLEPIVHFTSTQPDGSPEEIQMSASQFEKWLVDNRVTEKFDSREDLESELGVVDFIKPGQSFNYQDPEKTPPAPAEGEAGLYPTVHPDQCTTVTIVKIEDGKVHLDHPVVLDGPGATPTAAAGGGGARRSAELDFGEFARWYRKYSVVPETNEMAELENLLGQHHQKLIKEMGWPADHGEPISLEKGPFPQYLVSAYRPEIPPVAVRGVNGDKIETDQGDSLTPYQFFRGVREHGLTRPTPAQLAELQQAAAAKKDAPAAAKLAAIAAQPNNPQDSADAKASLGKPGKSKGFWERVKEFWGNTQVLSLMEAYEVFIKAPKERIKEWMKDKSERRQYAVGKEFYKNFPKFGGLNHLSNSYEDKLNGKNATDVKNTEEFFDKNCTVKDVFEVLYEDPNRKVLLEPLNKNTLKACLQFLSKKGQLRWEDDPKLWAALNKFLAGAVYPEKHHRELGPSFPVVAGDMDVTKRAAVDIFDQCQALIDHGWGTGTYEQIFGNNEREYQNQKKDIAEKIHAKYEYRGGIKVALKKMLHDWESGIPVKQAEFDGLLSEAAAKMEIDLDQAVFLLVSAFSMKNEKTGQTLLSSSRLNAFIPYLRRHQMFFFFADNHEIIDEHGNKVKTKFNYDLFAQVYQDVISKDIAASGRSDYEKFSVGQNTRDWIMTRMLTDKVVKSKMDENAGSADIDVNGYQFVGPIIKQANLDRVISKSHNSLQKPEVLKNMYAGYNEQLKVKARLLSPGASGQIDESRTEEFMDMVYGFIYFNNVLKNRIKRNQYYMRMDEAAFDTVPQADKKKQRRTTLVYCHETERFMANFVDGMTGLLNKMAEESSSGEEKNKLSAEAAKLAALNRSMMHDSTSVLNDNEEEEYRNAVRRNIKLLSAKKPAELAGLAQSSSRVMQGMFD